jgi:hypothetical protein
MSQAETDDTTTYSRLDAMNDIHRVVECLAFLEATIGAHRSLVDIQETPSFPAVSGFTRILAEARQALVRASTGVGG